MKRETAKLSDPYKEFTRNDAEGRYIHCEYLEFQVHKKDATVG